MLSKQQNFFIFAGKPNPVMVLEMRNYLGLR